MRKKKRFTKMRKRLLLCAAAMLVSVAGLLFRQIFLQTTCVITDGSRVMVHATTETDPKTVLGEAGLELGANDIYTAHSGDGILRINVRREQKLLVDYYGQKMEVTSRGESVEELLTRLNLTWSDADVISVPQDSQTFDGMVVTVARVIQENQTYTTFLPHETVYCADPSLPEGTQKIITEGEDGQVLCEATVTYLNGVESKREVLSQQVISQPVREIIAVGSGARRDVPENPVAEIENGTITLPTGEVLTYTEKVTCLATAYHCEGYVGTTATGTRARVGAIAVDPEVFPYGTRFYIVTKDGEYIYGVATAEDCGSKQFIYGTRLDLFFNTKNECVQFGARSCDVYILG